MAFNGNRAWYISTAAYTAATAWATGQAKVVGDIVRATAPAAGSERIFVCTVAGTTHATTEPTWTTTRGAITTDNGISWQECTGLSAINGDMSNTPTWTVGAKSTAVTLGHVVKSDDGTKILICTVAGTAGATEPTWGTTTGVDIADGATLKWKLLKTGSAVFGNWAGPLARMSQAVTTNWGDVAGQIFYLSSDHAETTATAGGPTSRGSLAAPNQWLSVDRTGSVPPVAADLEVGALIENTTTANFDLNGWLKRCFGITFRVGNGGSNANSIRPTSASEKFFDNCRFELNSTSSGAAFSWSNVGNHGRWRFKECVFKFGHTNNCIFASSGALEEYIGCSIDGAGAAPTSLFRSSGDACQVHGRGCDFSVVSSFLAGTGGGQNNSQFFLFEGCKLSTAVLAAPFRFADSTATDQTFGLVDRCSDGTANNYLTHWQQFCGTLRSNILVVRNGGAQLPDTQALSWSMVSTSNCNIGGSRFDSLKMLSYNDVVSDDVTITVYGVSNTAAMLTQANVWLEIQYPGSSASSIFTCVDTLGDTISTATDLTADTSDWDNNAPARQNTHAYVVGDVISLASNPGRIFFCTVAGTSAGSEPGGYASAVDGGAVTDSGATFRAGWRFKIEVALTSPDQPQLAGNIITQAVLGLASTTIYIDPAPVLT